ncbi:MAG: elongation factor G [Chloroflexota bacterium]|nr:elongation factor G [Chloroflexota bacterium]
MQYGLENIRNLCLLSHAGAGKTSLSEAILFATGAITRLGRVDEGTTTSDYDPDEIKRRISINLSILPFTWKDTKINLLDTPGYSDFAGEVKAAIRVSEAALIVICAASGIEVGTEQVWKYTEEAKLPRIIFINRMDRENADFYRIVKEIQPKFGTKCIPVQLPIGAQSDLQGVVDLLTMKAYTGTPVKEGEIPAALQAQAKSFREKLIEAIAEVDDKLLEKYLGGEELSLKDLTDGLRQATASGKVVPILAGSGLKSVGISLLLDAIISYLPSPKEKEVVVTDGQPHTIKPSEDGPLAALVFKTSADPYVGKLTYFRVYTGVMESNSQVWDANHNEAERIGQLFLLRGKNQESVPQVRAGDMGAVAKLGITATGDTLSSREKPMKLAPVHFPKPIFSQAVRPKTKADLDKLGTALTRLAEEDPTIHVRKDPDTAETIISGLGETQLQAAAEKMQRKFGVNVELSLPRVPYKETITVANQAEYKHKKQTGGHGQYGHVFIELEPLPRGTGTEFVDKVVGGSVPRNYIPAVGKGVNEAFKEGGVLAGYPVADVRATLYDGSYHAVDSSDVCFKIAGAGAIKKGLSQGQPILLEPIMNLKVTVPEEFTGDIIGDLNTKRARVLGMAPENGTNVIEAQVPLAEIQRYTIDLKSITQGRATYTISYSHYEQVPPQVVQKIVAERQAEKEKAKAAA